MAMSFKISLWAEEDGRFIEQNIFGYKTEYEAWDEYSEKAQAFEEMLGVPVDGTVYGVTEEESARLGLQK